MAVIALEGPKRTLRPNERSTASGDAIAVLSVIPVCMQCFSGGSNTKESFLEEASPLSEVGSTTYDDVTQGRQPDAAVLTDSLDTAAWDPKTKPTNVAASITAAEREETLSDFQKDSQAQATQTWESEGSQPPGSTAGTLSESSVPNSESLRSTASCFALDQRYLGGETAQAKTAEECREQCLQKPGCSHFNFLGNSLTCEHVFAKALKTSSQSAPLKDFKGSLAASADCQLATQFLASQKPTVTKGTEDPSGKAEHSTTSPKSGVEKGADYLHLRAQQCSDKYVLSDTFKGNDFWEPSKFFFFEWGDPTGGTVKYVNKSEAQKYNLIKTTSDGRAQILVDTTEVLSAGQGRKAIRLTSQKAWSDVG